MITQPPLHTVGGQRRPKVRWWQNVGVAEVITFFCMCQVLIAIGCSSLVNFNLTQGVILNVERSLNEAAKTISDLKLLELLTKISLFVSSETAVPAKCSGIVAEWIRDRHVKPEDEQKLARFLFTQTVVWNVSKAYLGARTGYYGAAQRFEQSNTSIQPNFFFESNTFGRPLASFNNPALQTVRFKVDDYGMPQADRTAGTRSFFVADEDWFRLTKLEGGPYWVDTQKSEMGLERHACTAIYDSQNVPRYKQGPGPSGQNVSMVACCGMPLSKLSDLLSQQQVGQGVAYIVEATGANAGALVAAARAGQPLPVYSTFGGALQANGYNNDALLAHVHKQLLVRFSSLKNVPDGAFITEATESTASKYSADPSEGQLRIRAAVYNGSISDWMIDRLGFPSREAFKIANMRWLIVVGMYSNFSQFDHAKQKQEDIIMMLIKDYAIVFSVLTVASGIISLVLGKRVAGRLDTFRGEILSVDNLKFMQEGKTKKSRRSAAYYIKEIHESFEELRSRLLVFTKYVPGSVLERIFSDKHQERNMANTLFMKNQTCTVVHSCIANFQDKMVATLSMKELVRVLELYLTTCTSIVEQWGGVVGDFVGDRVWYFWEDSMEDHATRACTAVLAQIEAIKELNTRWAEYDVPETVRLELNLGVHTGACFVGNIGTTERLKHDAVGDAVNLARRLSSINSTYHTTVLCTQTTHDLVVGSSTADNFRFKFINSLFLKGCGNIAMFSITYSNPGPIFSPSESFESKVSQSNLASDYLPDRARIVLVDSVHKPTNSLRHTNSITSEAGSTSMSSSSDAQKSGGCSAFLLHSVPAVIALSLFAMLQVLVAMSIHSALDISTSRAALDNYNVIINDNALDLVGETSMERFQGSRYFLDAKLQTMAECAMHNAAAFRDGFVEFNDVPQVWRHLRSLAFYYGVLISFFATRDSVYWEYEHIAGTLGAASSIYNTDAWNISNYRDTSVLHFDSIDEEGLPLLNVWSAYVPGYLPRQRPWFKEPRIAQEARWIKPYLWLPPIVELGVDVCVPLYDKSGLPRRNPLADTLIRNTSSLESLEGVMCCDDTLHWLARNLATLRNGAHGVTYIVEMDGNNAGVLVGAAMQDHVLPTWKEVVLGEVIDGFSFSSGDWVRFKAVNYSDNLMLSTTARYLYEKYGSWDTMQEGEHRLTSAYWTMKGVNWTYAMVGVQTAVLDGTLDKWKTTDDGRWTSDPYKIGGMRWLLVTAFVASDFIPEVEQVLVDASTSISKLGNTRIWITFVFCVASAILTYLSAKVAMRPILQLHHTMVEMQDLTFEDRIAPRHVKRSWFKEVANMQDSFNEMYEHLKVLAKYVPSAVVDNLSSKDLSSRSVVGKQTMRIRNCSVLRSELAGFAAMLETMQADALAKIIERYLEICSDVVRDLGGCVADFVGDKVVCFWEDSQVDHAHRACLAAIYCAQAIERIELEQDVWAAHEPNFFANAREKHLVARFGLHTGPCYVGNFGTRDRMKFGAVGTTVDVASRLASLNQDLDTRVLVSADMREAVMGSFLCRYVCSVPLGAEGSGLIYELVRKANAYQGPMMQRRRSSRVVSTLSSFTFQDSEYSALKGHAVEGGFVASSEWDATYVYGSSHSPEQSFIERSMSMGTWGSRKGALMQGSISRSATLTGTRMSSSENLLESPSFAHAGDSSLVRRSTDNNNNNNNNTPSLARRGSDAASHLLGRIMSKTAHTPQTPHPGIAVDIVFAQDGMSVSRMPAMHDLQDLNALQGTLHDTPFSPKSPSSSNSHVASPPSNSHVASPPSNQGLVTSSAPMMLATQPPSTGSSTWVTHPGHR